MDAETFRQRRNLMVTCCALLFLSFAQVRALDKASLAVFGVTVEVVRPHAIFIALWIFFAYFLMRYCIYALNRDQDRIISNFWARLNSVCNRLIEAQCRKKTGFRSFSLQVPGLPDAPTFLKTPRFEAVAVENPTGKTAPFVAEVSRNGLLARYVLEIFRFLLLDPTLTDFVLPLVLSAAVLWYAGLADWGGSFASIGEALRKHH